MLVPNSPGLARQQAYRIALAGNPNTGKTTTFNNITGARHKVANWPGVTVEKLEGHRTYKDRSLHIVDLPGTYSLTAYSLEEVIARNFILEEKPDVIIQIVDAVNIERNLYLFTQLRELGVKIVIALNIWDEAQSAGFRFKLKELSELLGAPIVPTVGRLNKNTDELLDCALSVIEEGFPPKYNPIDYGLELNQEILSLSRLLQDYDHEPDHARWMAIKLLENDMEARTSLENLPDLKKIEAQIDRSQKCIESFYHEDAETIIAERRYGFIHGACRETVYFPAHKEMNFTEVIDSILTNRVLGFPIFIFFIWALFQTAFTVGAYPMSGIDAAVGWSQDLIANLLHDGPLRDLLVNGVVGGVGSVIIFLPNILILFFGISIMEDTGYMARAAFLMDRVMRSIGLHGKSFIPMVMGFGCNVPAIMATRTLENPRDRIIVSLVNPLMSCSARLPVYILFAGAFFSESASGNILLSIYLLGILLAMGLAKLFSKSFFRGDPTPFVLELPPYRIPTWKSLFFHVWDRGSVYLKKMGGVILISSIIIWYLGEYPRTVSYSQPYQEQIQQIQDRYDPLIRETSDVSTRRDQLRQEMDQKIALIDMARTAEEQKNAYIGQIGALIEPIMEPLGFDWRMSVSLVTGIVAKEIVVSSLGVLHQAGDNEGLQKALRESGLTPLAAYGYMIFVLIYTPCLVTIITIKRETGSWKWMWLVIGYEFVLAWLLAFIIYQGGTLLGFG
ncbi:MAG: ferrous iron transport protein B [Candidatus Cloacimonetes bacterium 4572_55]|nr:MAG: ferrous iron transport protein B [Candidatus Cloacimonetes bacterium 4572_55]